MDRLLFILLATVMLSSCGAAQPQTPSPPSSEAPAANVPSSGATLTFRVIPAKQLHEKMQGAAQIFVIDMNSAARYAAGHVPGARHGRPDLAKALPPNKDAMVVLYCGSSRCGASRKAAQRAHALGYTNLFVMPEGIAGWLQLGLPTTSGGDARG